MLVVIPEYSWKLRNNYTISNNIELGKLYYEYGRVFIPISASILSIYVDIIILDKYSEILRSKINYKAVPIILFKSISIYY